MLPTLHTDHSSQKLSWLSYLCWYDDGIWIDDVDLCWLIINCRVIASNVDTCIELEGDLI